MSTILVGIDFSETADRVVRVASDLAQGLGATVYLIHVEPPDPDFVGYGPGPQHVRDHVAGEVMAHHEALRALREMLTGDGIEAHGLVIQGSVAEKIIEEAQHLQADLIVVGSHGHGALYDLLLGSVSEGVLRRATCPVVLIPAREAKT